MAGGRIDRDAWAREVQALVVRFDPGPRGEGNKSAFARRVGVTTKTMERWARQENDVKIETVRAVIDALQLTPHETSELLARIGFHLGVAQPPEPVDPRKDPVIRMILDDPQWTERERVNLVNRELERIRLEQERRIEEYTWFLSQKREERGTA